MTRRAPAALAVLVLFSQPLRAGDTPAGPPFFESLGSWHRAVTTTSPDAQRWFDQGLRLMYAFNLEEAQRSFQEAARLDPACASCQWGVGLALGPHINLPALPDRTRAAFQAVQRAQAAAAQATPVEQALVAALAKRYADPAPTDPAAQRALDEAYAAAMKDAHARFPQDLDVAALYVEGLMDLHPWDLWHADGTPQPWTGEIVSTLEAILAKEPQHPGANHYYIHAVEASPHPERALAAAGRLPSLMPGAGHIVHMPAHVYMRLGRYGDAAEANRRAIAAEDVYVRRAQPAGFYSMYLAHNHQFLMASAMMQGREKEALQGSRDTLTFMPAEMLKQMPGFDFGLAYPAWVLARFSRWKEVAAEPAPPGDFPVAVALWRGAHGLALAAEGKLDEASSEQALVQATLEATPPEALEGLNPARALLGIASHLVAGDVAVRRGQVADGIAHLEQAVTLEDALRYNEPSDWYFPTRHVLGAALLAARQPAKAQAVFEADLQRNKENAWALAGLERSLHAQKREAQAAAVHARFLAAAKDADGGVVFAR